MEMAFAYDEQEKRFIEDSVAHWQRQINLDLISSVWEAADLKGVADEQLYYALYDTGLEPEDNEGLGFASISELVRRASLMNKSV